jgi:hypothetical protein
MVTVRMVLQSFEEAVESHMREAAVETPDYEPRRKIDRTPKCRPQSALELLCRRSKD